MRILQGTRVVEAAPGWRQGVLNLGRRSVVDLGAGDGRWAYERARGDASGFYVAVDPDSVSLAEYAFRASRRPARGGLDNIAFVVAAVEDLPPELLHLADTVRVNFPWGSLLRGLLRPEAPVLRGLRSMGRREAARFELVMCYDPGHDLGAFPGESLPALDEQYIDSVLLPAYSQQGLVIEERRRLGQEEALALPSTWGRRLLHGRQRDVYFLAGSIAVEPLADDGLSS